MCRLCTILVCFACITFCSAFATDGLPRQGISDDRPGHGTEAIDIDGPLFDYPISRAVGIDVSALLAPRGATPGIYDLASNTNR